MTNPRPLTPAEIRHLGLTDRGPGETLQDYFVRHQWQMAGMIRTLKGDLDALYAKLADERVRWRRHMVLLAIGEAGFAVAGVIVLDHYGVATRAAPVAAGLIGLCALLGAALAIRLLAAHECLSAWMRTARHRAWRLLCWIMLGEDEPAVQRLPAWIDISRPEVVDAVVEERVAQSLALDAFFWRARWLIGQVAIIVTLFACVQIARGATTLSVVESASVVAIVFLFGGGLIVLAADLVSTNLARLSRWWRRP